MTVQFTPPRVYNVEEVKAERTESIVSDDTIETSEVEICLKITALINSRETS